jgi:hypothetical protein
LRILVSWKRSNNFRRKTTKAVPFILAENYDDLGYQDEYVDPDNYGGDYDGGGDYYDDGGGDDYDFDDGGMDFGGGLDF